MTNKNLILINLNETKKCNVFRITYYLDRILLALHRRRFGIRILGEDSKFSYSGD